MALSLATPINARTKLAGDLHAGWRALLSPDTIWPLLIGAVAQLGERCVRNAEVRGSIPLSSTNSSLTV
jgi:hypothetical protein